MNIWRDLQSELDARAAAHGSRELRRVPDGALDLASNDYLGLAVDPRVVEAAQIAAAKFGTGARASRLVSGHYDGIEELEIELARFKNCEAALVFSSGYAANVGTIAALGNENSALFCHKRNHASLIDACELAKAPTRFFDSIDKLRALLASSHVERKLIICDGVFSMDGDLCDLPALVNLADEFDAIIVLDDAHGTGTLGKSGRGTVEHFGESRGGGGGGGGGGEGGVGGGSAGVGGGGARPPSIIFLILNKKLMFALGPPPPAPLNSPKHHHSWHAFQIAGKPRRFRLRPARSHRISHQRRAQFRLLDRPQPARRGCCAGIAANYRI